MAWRVSARRGLSIKKQSSWPSNAKSKILNQFKKPGGGYKSGAAGAFLVADSSKSDTQDGYKLPFAVVSGGKITGASSAGLAAAARRLPQVKGVPSSVLAGARKVIDSYQAKMKEDDMPPQGLVAELELDMSSFSMMIRKAFHARFRIRPDVMDRDETPVYMYVEDIFYEHSSLGNSVVIVKSGSLWQVSYEIETDDSIMFAPPNEWVHVRRTYVPVTSASSSGEVAEVVEDGEVAELGEADVGAVLGLVESDDDGPLQLNIAVIEPGWGNTRDNNFYPKEMLERDAKVFQGAKMYATNHRTAEKSVLTEVSQVLECPVGFTESGAPIARVGVFSDAFAESIRNRDKLGVLDSLHCSILAGGKVQKGFSSDGRKGRKVLAITEAVSVDWVTKHGAGGRALSIAESDNETLMEAQMNEHDDLLDTEAEATSEDQVEEAELIEEENETATDDVSEADETEEEEEATESDPEPEPETFLAESEVKEIVGEVKNLPDATVARLIGEQYHNRYEVIAAIESEQSYLKMITDSGKPPKMGDGDNGSGVVSEADVQERQKAVNEKWLPRVG